MKLGLVRLMLTYLFHALHLMLNFVGAVFIFAMVLQDDTLILLDAQDLVTGRRHALVEVGDGL